MKGYMSLGFPCRASAGLRETTLSPQNIRSAEFVSSRLADDEQRSDNSNALNESFDLIHSHSQARRVWSNPLGAYDEGTQLWRFCRCGLASVTSIAVP